MVKKIVNTSKISASLAVGQVDHDRFG